MALLEHTLQTAINKVLALDPELPDKLQAFEGKVIELQISGLRQSLFLLPHKGGIDIRRDHDAAPDTILRGSPVALAKMGLTRDVAPLLLKGEVEIIGDLRLGRAFKRVLSDMRIDWEELLASVTGDVIAHELFRRGKAVAQWGKRSGESLAMDVSEYLQEENRTVVSAGELQQFYDDVDSLHSDVERFAARLNQILRERG